MVRPDGQVKQAVNEKYNFEVTLAIAESRNTWKIQRQNFLTAEIISLCKQGDKPSREFFGALAKNRKIN
jgi:hypothetical protein